MKTRTCLVALTIVIALCAACGTEPYRKADMPHDVSNKSGHDMSNMPGHDMSNMNMNAASAQDAASQPFDLQFIDSMIHHHEGAVKMSESIIAQTKRAELKAFAQKVIQDQTKEIAQMKAWRDSWYPGKPSALNMEMPGIEMSHGVGHEKGFGDQSADLQFLDMMTPHHEGAIKMAEEALKKAEHPEIKQLADAIIKAQRAEIEQMNAWKKEWSK